MCCSLSVSHPCIPGVFTATRNIELSSVAHEDDHRLEERRFVEDFSLYFEQMGYPRSAGRILGWLLICDPPVQSTGELADALGASKGSRSTMTRLLIQVGLIERAGMPGRRRDYSRIKPARGRS